MDKSPPDTTVRVVPLGLTLSSFLLVTYTLCIVFGLLAPETFHMHSGDRNSIHSSIRFGVAPCEFHAHQPLHPQNQKQQACQYGYQGE